MIQKGMSIAGLSPSGNLVEIIELPNHPWFVAVPVPSGVPFEAAGAASVVPWFHWCGDRDAGRRARRRLASVPLDRAAVERRD